jgi:DNA damage-inducible protein 1
MMKFVHTVRRVKASVSIDDIPGDVTPEALLSLVQGHPHLLIQLKSQDSELGAILESGDLGALRMLMMKRFMSRHKAVYSREREMEAIEADPMNEANQRKIEDQIRQANVEQNMALAIENLPE